jgi:hypothetical protein
MALPAQQQAKPDQLGFPAGFKTFALAQPAGLNLQESRSDIGDQETAWQENYIRLGNGNLRTLYDVGPDAYVAVGGTAVVSTFFYNLGNVDYGVAFLDDGTADQFRLSDGLVTPISAVTGTFFHVSGIRPGCAQWGNQYLLIVNNNTPNDYWIWDGTSLFTSGTVSPVITLTDGGIGYTSVPAVTVFGGHGSGVTAVATVENGTVTEITIVNAGSGYVLGDALGIAFSGGGNDGTAQLSCTVAGGVITAVTIVNAGTGYAETPKVLIRAAGGGGNNATAVVSGVNDSGQITGIYITNAGSGYGSPKVAIISVTGGGAQFTALPTGASGGIDSIVVNNGGFGYLSQPKIIIVGGNGTGAILSAQVDNTGKIASVVIVNGGQGYKTAPTLIVTGGNTAADALIDIMPFGVSGQSIETYQSRVWITNTNKILFSAPGSTGDFSTAAGGGTVRSTEPFLKTEWPAIKQANGFLYPMGDSSINVISNVQTSGSPAVTTFNNANTDPQIGTPWRDSVQTFGRAIIFAGPTGIFGLFGGTAEKLSDKINNLFLPVARGGIGVTMPTTGADQPCGAVADIFNVRCYLFLLPIVDPFSGHTRKIMAGWDGKTFFLASQSKALTFIATQETDSDPVAYGTDGRSIFQLFKTPSIANNKVLQSKLWAGDGFIITKQVLQFYFQIQDRSNDEYQVFGALDNECGANQPFLVTSDGTFQWINQDQGIFGWENNDPGEFFWKASNCSIGGFRQEFYGQLLGFTMRSASKDHVLTTLVIGYKNYHALGF